MATVADLVTNRSLYSYTFPFVLSVVVRRRELTTSPRNLPGAVNFGAIRVRKSWVRFMVTYANPLSRPKIYI